MRLASRLACSLIQPHARPAAVLGDERDAIAGTSLDKKKAPEMGPRTQLRLLDTQPDIDSKHLRQAEAFDESQRAVVAAKLVNLGLGGNRRAKSPIERLALHSPHRAS